MFKQNSYDILCNLEGTICTYLLFNQGLVYDIPTVEGPTVVLGPTVVGATRIENTPKFHLLLAFSVVVNRIKITVYK